MRTAGAITAGALAALAILSVPALAANSDHQRDDSSASSSCSSYQRDANGAWVAIPCQEVGSRASPRQKNAAQSTDDDR
ncbi:hypothetical protein OO17_10725 [Rhodopseudomonas palustris]|uniref:Uncharacterized protein n=1 Tax=Rhodopseudomonas palustris TaxID=1076 RepID=A0A0D7ET41_RHOPL|nr:hypothetical protein OO17_10725 [Rhodopseudomonas palustris]